jgi:hypothetical protein
MPCRRAWRGELDDAQVHWNGQGGAYGGSEVAAPRGIDHTCVEQLDGEVIGPGAVGVVLPKLGVHEGHGDGYGGVECCRRVAARWGREGESAGVAITCWGSRAVPGRRIEGERGPDRKPRASFLPSMPSAKDK